MEKAIANENLISWPIENLNFPKLLKTTIATEKGHLDQEHKYLNPSATKDLQRSNKFPTEITEKTNNLVIKIFNPLYDNQLREKSYMDLTGRFPHKSSRGNS